MRKIVISGIIGNALEWYDFALYGHFVAVISKLYFPSNDHTVSLLITFGAFAAGFLMRPVGAIFFGYIGDKYGRKAALSFSIMTMAIPTACIGLLPTYAQIGIFAPILLTIIRLLQGLSLGGEFSGSISFIVEHAPKERRGFAGSSAMFSMNLGILLGSAAAFTMSHTLSHDDFIAWGWRLPFLVGFFIGLVGLYIRKAVPESPAYEKMHKMQSQSNVRIQPTKILFQEYFSELVKGITIYLTVTVPFFIFTVFLNNYMSQFVGRSMKEALLINTISMLIMTAFVPLFGYLSDIYGRKIILKIGAFGFIIFSYPAFILMSHAGLMMPLIGQTIVAICVACYMSPVPAVLAELFPTSIRFTGVALSYNLSAAIFGGTAPIVSTFLIHRTEINEVVALYIIIVSIISLFSVNKILDKRKVELY